MPYVVFDNSQGMYISKARESGFDYTVNINQAQVYRDKAGAKNAVGEPMRPTDPNYKKGKLVIPEYMDLIEVEVTETGVIEKGKKTFI